jgi:alkylation response protein AidB-like acyl-CoA dehydrogenase
VQADRELGGLTALVKAQTGRILSECAQCAVLLFGGKGYTRTGQGELVERMHFLTFYLCQLCLLEKVSIARCQGLVFPEVARTCFWIWQFDSW